MARYFCEEQVVPADGADYTHPLDAAEAMFERANILVGLDVGAGVESVSMRFEVSPDNATWYRVRVYDFWAVAYVAAVTITVDTSRLAASLDNYAPYIRMIATNTGANDATLTVLLIPQV